MNIIQLVKEECERISKKGTYLSMEAENIKKRAKEKFYSVSVSRWELYNLWLMT